MYPRSIVGRVRAQYRTRATRCVVNPYVDCIIDSSINNAKMGIEVQNTYAPAEGKRRSSGGPAETRVGIAGRGQLSP